MAAGLGFKTFTTGEVLTAADVNGYLMQGVLVFATEAARNSAITSPQEGQFAFTKDTNSLWYYSGSAWVASGATGDIEGVTAGTGISGGGTSGTVTITNSMATAIDAKGDLVVGTGADAFSRLGVGANNTVLTADSAEATGLKWAAPAGGKNYSLINAGGTSLSGSSTSITGISAKDSILVVVIGASCTAGSIEIQMTINSDTAANYTNQQNSIVAPASYNTNNFSGGGGYSNGNSIEIGRVSDVAASVVSSSVFINGANSAGDKVYQVVGGGTPAGNDGQRLYWGAGVWENSSTVASVQIIASGGTFDAGTVYIWGSA